MAMPKSAKEIDAAYRKTKHDHGLIWKGFWMHKDKIAAVQNYVAKKNKEALKVDE